MACKTTHRDISLFPVRILHYPYHISTVFPTLGANSGLGATSRRSSSTSLQKTHGGDEESDVVGSLIVVDYRYSRFALDPRTGLFGMTRYVSPLCSWHARV
jgi:cation-transporting ATPase 13A3/4/5